VKTTEKKEVSKKSRGANHKESLLREVNRGEERRQPRRRKKSSRRVGERPIRSRSYVKTAEQKKGVRKKKKEVNKKSRGANL
jgi:hypothetical protein